MLRRSAGFTLVELLIAAFGLALVVVYSLGSFTALNQTATVVDQVSEAQQNSRAVAALIERDLRNAGYLVPVAGAVCGVDSTTGPDTLYVSDSDAIRTVDELPLGLRGSDLGAITSVEPDDSVSTTTLSVDTVIIDGVASYRKDSGSAGLDSDFRVGAGAIVVDALNTDRGVACGRVTAVTTGGTPSVTVAFDSELDSGSGISELVVIPAHVYRIDTGVTPFQLERNGTKLAADVEDLQVAYFYDADGDGLAAATEYEGNSSTNVYDPEAVDGANLLDVRFSVVIATRGVDPRKRTNASRGEARENRDPTTVPGDDGRHRRVYTSTVRIRNNTT